MAKFLIDENLSTAIAVYLRKNGLQAKAVRELGLRGEPDDAILNFADKQGWIIITGDIEFGKFFYEKLGKISMIVIRSKRQNIRATIEILEKLRQEKIFENLSPKHYLVLAGLDIIRIRKYEK